MTRPPDRRPQRGNPARSPSRGGARARRPRSVLTGDDESVRFPAFWRRVSYRAVVVPDEQLSEEERAVLENERAFRAAVTRQWARKRCGC